MKNKILIAGNDGRAYATGLKLAAEPDVDMVFFSDLGNGGTHLIGENVPIPGNDIAGLASFAKKVGIDLTIPCSEDLLAEGFVDHFDSKGLRVFGPTKLAASIEISKSFAKMLMKEVGIPTAPCAVFSNYLEAVQHAKAMNGPCMVKASGLARGRGANECANADQAEAALHRLMVEKIHGEGGRTVIIEQLFSHGLELSAHSICHGGEFQSFPFAMDHKKEGDGDKGDYTGGMGAISPVPWTEPDLLSQVNREVVSKTLRALSRTGMPFDGCLFPGLMQTPGGLKVLEFNARFGDPETQVYMSNMESGLLPLLESSIDGHPYEVKVKWKPGFSVCINLVCGDYPRSFTGGIPIEIINSPIWSNPDLTLIHAGTMLDEGRLVTCAGRVMGVRARGETLQGALDLAYEAVKFVHFDGIRYRTDIGKKALSAAALVDKV